MCPHILQDVEWGATDADSCCLDCMTVDSRLNLGIGWRSLAKINADKSFAEAMMLVMAIYRGEEATTLNLSSFTSAKTTSQAWPPSPMKLIQMAGAAIIVKLIVITVRTVIALGVTWFLGCSECLQNHAVIPHDASKRKRRLNDRRRQHHPKTQNPRP